MDTDTEKVDWLLAPLAGYTDVPFRLACRRQGCLYAFTPLIDAGALCHGNRKNEQILARGEDEGWLGTQLLGSDPDSMGRATEMLSRRPWDRLDINMGCPVPKVTRKGAGAALPSVPTNARACVQAVMAQARGIPVSAKIRILHDEDPEPTARFAESLQEEGIRALTIHGRTWGRVYSGPVSAKVIRGVRERLSIPVIANGGIFTRADGLSLSVATGCRQLMVARGAIGNPWIFRDLASPDAPRPSHEEVCEELARQVEGMVSLYGEKTAMRNGRKIILATLCGRGYRRSLRARVGEITTVREFAEFLHIVRGEGPSDTYNPDEGPPPLQMLL